MTFSLSLDEWIEAHRVYERSRNRFLPFMAPSMGLLGALLLVVALPARDIFGSLVGAFLVWCCLELLFIGRLRLRAKFRREVKSDHTLPITYEFSAAGFTLHSAKGAQEFFWYHIGTRVQGPHIWLFVVKAKKPYFLILPKSALQNPEAQREWAIVEAHFAPPQAPPIASPHG